MTLVDCSDVLAKKLDIHDNVTTNGVVRRTIAYGLESAESRSSNTFVEMSNFCF